MARVTRFTFASESLLAKVALELRHWGVKDSRWWLGKDDLSLCTKDNNVIDVITETLGFDGGDGRYAWEKFEPEKVKC